MEREKNDTSLGDLKTAYYSIFLLPLIYILFYNLLEEEIKKMKKNLDNQSFPFTSGYKNQCN